MPFTKLSGAEMHHFYYSQHESSGNNFFDILNNEMARANPSGTPTSPNTSSESPKNTQQTTQESDDVFAQMFSSMQQPSDSQDNTFNRQPNKDASELADIFGLVSDSPPNNTSDEPAATNLEDFFSRIETGESTLISPDIFESAGDETKLEDLFTVDTPQPKVEATINTAPLASSHTEAKESSTSTDEDESKTIEFDLDGYLESIMSDLNSKKYLFNPIKTMRVMSPESEALKFVRKTLQDNLDSFGTSLNIEQMVQPPSQEESIAMIFEYLNLKENLNGVSDRKNRFLFDLDNNTKGITGDIKKDLDVLIKLIQRNRPELEETLSELYQRESRILADDERNFISLIERAETLAVQAELSNNQELFEETEDISGFVAELKERVVGILGTKYIKDSKTEFEIPKNREELEELLDHIADIASNAEVKDTTVYDKVGFKLLRMLYKPTAYTGGELRMIVGLLNTLAISVIAVKFKTITVGLFVMSAAFDMFNQFRLAGKNSNIALLADFARNSDTIIDSLKNSITQEKIEETRINSAPTIEQVKEFFSSVRELLMEVYEDKQKEIDSLTDESELITLVQEHFLSLKSDLELKKDSIVRDYGESLAEFEEQLKGKLEAKEREIRLLPNEDIYEDVNRGNTVYSNRYKVARITVPDTDLGIDFSRNVEEGSYLIKCSGINEREKIANFVKMLIMQQQTHLKPGHLLLNVFDTEQVGAMFMDMASDEDELFKIYTRPDAMDEKIEDLIYEITSRHNIALKNFNSITEYNNATHVTNAKPFPYIINFWYNIPKETASKIDFQTIIKEGKKAGMINVYIMDENHFFSKKQEKEVDILYDYNKNFDYIIEKDRSNIWNLAHNVATATAKGPIFHHISRLETKLIEYKKDKVVEKAQNLDKFLADTRSTLILYQDLQEGYAKELFTKNTLTGIDICVGFRDGDMNKPEYVRIDDELVHCLMAGKTGAGKSNTINVTLLNLLRNYSPEWLEMFMIDFKNVEFNFYTHEKDFGKFTKKLSLVPHASMLAGTTDPEYALSVFSQALKEMERRKKILSKGLNGVVFKKIESYNRYVLENNLRGTKDGKGNYIKIIPRILILLDEFQVMFKMEDQDKLQKIKQMIERLSREARSMGIHMYFTSQSMDGTLSDDVKNQFAMRFCLSASSETSKSVLGNDASSKLKGKGWIYMSGTQERKPEDNRLFKVPLLEEKYNKQALMEINNACIQLNKQEEYVPVHSVEYYDESERHSTIELKEWLNHKEVQRNRQALLLGNKVVFRSYSNPENTIINNADTENILVTGNDKLALANTVNSLIANYATKERTRVVVLNCDRNMDGMIKEEYVNKDFMHLLSSSDIVPFIESINGDVIGPATDIDPEKQKEPTAMDKFNDIFGEAQDDDEAEYIPDKYDPNVHTRWVIVIIGIHKAEGFNEDYVDDKYMQPLMHMLKYGPLQGVTTILNYKTPFKARKFLPQFSHRISTRVDDDISYELFNGKGATQLFSEDGLNFALYKNNISGETFKFKVFEFEYDKSLLSAKKITGLSLVV